MEPVAAVGAAGGEKNLAIGVPLGDFAPFYLQGGNHAAAGRLLSTLPLSKGYLAGAGPLGLGPINSQKDALRAKDQVRASG